MKPTTPTGLNRFLKWLGQRLFAPPQPEVPGLPPVAVRVRPPAQRNEAKSPALVRFKSTMNSEIDDGGPGKNVLIRSKMVREDTGTHDTLKILDESMLESGEEFGIDPYNTGRFDRAKSWESRSRK
jgi:hypothetical protein